MFHASCRWLINIAFVFFMIEAEASSAVFAAEGVLAESCEFSTRLNLDSYFGEGGVLRRYGLSRQSCAFFLLLIVFTCLAIRSRCNERALRVAHQKLNKQVLLMQCLLDAAPAPLYMRDSQGALLLCNRAYLDFFNVEAEHVVGQKLSHVYVVDSALAVAYEKVYKQVFETGKTFTDLFSIQFDQRFYQLYLWVCPQYSEQGEIIAVACGWTDVSEREYLIDTLRQDKSRAETESHYKSHFLAVMSHELRTPMSAMIGALELAKNPAGADDAPHLIGIAHQSAQNMLELIGDVLDISKIESGKLELNLMPCQPVQLVQTVIDNFSSVAREKNINLEFSNEGVDISVHLDGLRFRQVISNLISNALKFTPQGVVCVSLAITQLNDTRAELQLRVEDTGIGIDPVLQDRLFKPYSQILPSDLSRQSGTGLGLAICKHLMSLMSGSLACYSKLGQGSCFSISVEVDVSTTADTRDYIDQCDSPACLSPSQILLVEDDELSRRVLQLQLESLGMCVTTARDGVEALGLWKTEHFDCVITDGNMPRMGGDELTRQIRSHEQEQGRLPVFIIGLTANAQQQEVLRCKASGMNDCLFKPLTQHKLISILSVAEQKRQRSAEQFESFDIASIHAITQGNLDRIDELLSTVSRTSIEDLAAMQAYFACGNFTALAGLGHKIKGGARMIRAEGLVAACSELERCCERNFSPNEIRSLIEELSRRICSLVRGVERAIGRPLSFNRAVELERPSVSHQD